MLMIKSSRTKSAEPHPEIRPLVKALKRFLRSFFSGMMDFSFQLNLTMAQFRALHTIGRMGRASGRQLARELQVSPAAVVPLCDRLETQGYIRRVADTADRRITWFELTASGAGLFERMTSASRSRLGPALARLSPADRQTLTRILDELAAALPAEAQR